MYPGDGSNEFSKIAGKFNLVDEDVIGHGKVWLLACGCSVRWLRKGGSRENGFYTELKNCSLLKYMLQPPGQTAPGSGYLGQPW